MGKVLGSWSGMRKYLEKEMIADCLKGRVRYDCTRYIGMDGCRIIKLFIDNQSFKAFSWETLNTYFIENGYKKNANPIGIDEYWDDFFKLWKQFSILERTEYTDEEFCEALTLYRRQGIKESIISKNPLVMMFALLDRRIGKRTLTNLKERMSGSPEWLKNIYQIRLDAENICLY